MNSVSTRREGPVLVVRASNPPLNVLSLAVRRGLNDAIEFADAEDSVEAVVIIGVGRTFFAGADIAELGRRIEPPTHLELVDRVEACSKPVIAAIHGTALGGGLELALACHYRIAVPSAQLGLPEVTLGVLAGAGGTQRLPRLIGVSRALEMVTGGEPIGAIEAHEIGLVDAIVEGELEPQAIAFADAVRGVRPLPRASTREDRLDEARTNPRLFDDFRRVHARNLAGSDAAEQAICAVEMATQVPYVEGGPKAFDMYLTLAQGEQAKALQYLFFATRKAARIEGRPDDVHPREVRRIGLVGAGAMGSGIAMDFLSSGLPVTIVETNRDALDRGVAAIKGNYESAVSRGRMAAADAEHAIAFLTPVPDLTALADHDLIVEAVFEDITVTRDLFRRLDEVAKPGAILASNSSFLDLDDIAAATRRPQDVVGMHFFAPAHSMNLLEIVRGRATAPDVLATVMPLAKRIGKVVAISGACAGSIGNRMLIARQEQAIRLVLEGATPEQVDRVHVDFGFPMGPFQMLDLFGNDVGRHHDPTRIESIADTLCAIGRFGQKNGCGYYDYDERHRPVPSDDVHGIIEHFRAQEAIEPREIDDREIVERTLYTMINEAAEILEEGIAQRASDIDVIWTKGYGWPRQTGGPMFWADGVGLSGIVEGLRRQQARLGSRFTLSRLLLDKASSGHMFVR